ncbi:dTDP-4-dehydrorhamnose reductase [Paenibacillus oceani]|uniref:dTDP-4-dehydrorhamnose reductase n=1 Tax=Paenibacillus oceani TaxID=2772510 RepID=UPI001681DC29|nr:dTDP-4-dehydrorhamnose reductase [Paenibacillus oceani]
MKILITGVSGQLGGLMHRIFEMKHEVYGHSSSELDITNRSLLLCVIRNIKPDVILNCASYNHVDSAEENSLLAEEINSTGVKYLAELSNIVGAKLVHISTDYVFDGTKGIPYDENDKTNPLNVYGRTKLRGEEYVKEICEQYIIVRTSWLYGTNKRNFVNTILTLSHNKNEILVVNDQKGNPTYAPELAMRIDKLITEGFSGLFHCSGDGICSWYEFATSIIHFSNKQNVRILPVPSEYYPSKANRPRFSALDNSKITSSIGIKMPNWKDSLEGYLMQMR